MDKDVICYETFCLYNTACDTFEYIQGEPMCTKCEEDCPNKIVIDF